MNKNKNNLTISGNKLLITGERRSGTTLLANLLNSQKKIKINRDFLHMHRMMPSLGISSITTPISIQQNKILQQQFKAWNSALGITINMRNASFGTMLEFYNYVLAEISEKGKDIVGHKSTMAHEIVGDLLDNVPKLKVIYIVRDPRDVVVSANKMWPNGAETIFDYIDCWKQSVTTMNQYIQQKMFPSRIFHLRFEDLILDPQNQLNRLSDFLGVNLIIPNSLNEYNNSWQNNSSFSDLTHEDKTQIFDSKPVGRWRSNNMTIGRIAESLLAKELRELGYDLSGEVGEEEQLFIKQKLRVSSLYYRNALLQQQQHSVA